MNYRRRNDDYYLTLVNRFTFSLDHVTRNIPAAYVLSLIAA